MKQTLLLVIVVLISGCSGAVRQSHSDDYQGGEPQDLTVFDKLLPADLRQKLDRMDSPLELDLTDAGQNVQHVPLTEDVPVTGAEDPLVTMVVFSDYQCPYCSRHEETINKLLELHKDVLRVAFLHYPLDFHKEARRAAQASAAAHRQGRFWDFHRKVFQSSRGLAELDMTELARKLELHVEDFKAALEDPELDKTIQKQIDLGSQLGVRGTPTVFINGIKVVGAVPLEVMEEHLRTGLGRAYVAMRTGTPRADLYDYLTTLEPEVKGGNPDETEPPKGRPGFLGTD